jgi:hypothetical protein
MQVSDVQGGELASARSGVGGQAQQQPDLLGAVPAPVVVVPHREHAGGVDVAIGGGQQVPNGVDRHVAAWFGFTRAAHAGQGLAGEQALVESPAERGPQRPDVQAGGGRRDAVLLP